MSTTDVPFDCPDSMKYWSDKVFAGEYFLPYKPYEKNPLTILDVGANCGAFALWARAQWPDSVVLAYEPSQIAFAFLSKNTAADAQIKIHRTAILDSDKTKLYAGAHNQGEATFYNDVNDLLDGTYELPPVMKPADLPACDILKLDTEGAELEILTGYPHTPDCIALEYHRESDRRAIDALLAERGYDLVGSLSTQPARGVVKYMRRMP